MIDDQSKRILIFFVALSLKKKKLGRKLAHEGHPRIVAMKQRFYLTSLVDNIQWIECIDGSFRLHN